MLHSCAGMLKHVFQQVTLSTIQILHSKDIEHPRYATVAGIAAGAEHWVVA